MCGKLMEYRHTVTLLFLGEDNDFCCDRVATIELINRSCAFNFIIKFFNNVILFYNIIRVIYNIIMSRKYNVVFTQRHYVVMRSPISEQCTWLVQNLNIKLN